MKKIKIAIIGWTLSTLSGCSIFQTPTPPPELQIENPSDLPASTLTTMSPALSCLDDMMVAYHKAPIYITAADINNFTSEHSLSSGMNEMLISSISKLGIRSGGVRYVSFDPSVQNILSLQGAHPDKADFRAPDYFIRGGVTQVNKNLWSGQNGIGGSVELDPGQLLDGGSFFILQGQDDLTKSISNSSNYVSLSMDINAGYISNLQIIPGAVSSNTLGMQMQNSSAISGDISVHDIGISYSLSDSATKDLNTMLRMLVEVASIEIVGKLQAIPYHRCLLNAGTNAETYKNILPIFMEKSVTSPNELIKIVQNALSELDYYKGPISGVLDNNTSEAIAKYQLRMGLLTTGAIGFDTFRMINTLSPTRDMPYSTWWVTDNQMAGEAIGIAATTSATKTQPKAQQSKSTNSTEN
jgi:hypothetical protein